MCGFCYLPWFSHVHGHWCIIRCQAVCWHDFTVSVLLFLCLNLCCLYKCFCCMVHYFQIFFNLIIICNINLTQSESIFGACQVISDHIFAFLWHPLPSCLMHSLMAVETITVYDGWFLLSDFSHLSPFTIRYKMYTIFFLVQRWSLSRTEWGLCLSCSTFDSPCRFCAVSGCLSVHPASAVAAVDVMSK